MVYIPGVVRQQLIVWTKQATKYGLVLNDRLWEMIVFLGKTTAEEQQEMAASVMVQVKHLLLLLW